MSGTAQPMPFSMPMFRSFVPERIRPWMYVFIAFTFQFSGGLYLGTLNQMMGETTLMREDLLMCLYANLAGMAIYFPLLSASAVAGVLHRRHVQDTRHV